jgi:xanthine/CO dehydrogenase XdhC/CoxF family maturation factor
MWLLTVFCAGVHGAAASASAALLGARFWAFATCCDAGSIGAVEAPEGGVARVPARGWRTRELLWLVATGELMLPSTSCAVGDRTAMNHVRFISRERFSSELTRIEETMAEIRKVAVVGAGTMGNGIVHVFAQNGYDVTMIDVRAEALEAAEATIAGNMDRQIRKGTLSRGRPRRRAGPHRDRGRALRRSPTPTWWWRRPRRTWSSSSASSSEMDRAAPAHAILASNTSSISITEIAGAHQARPSG